MASLKEVQLQIGQLAAKELEASLGLSSSACAQYLGVRQGNWSSWRNAKTIMPLYIRKSVAAHIEIQEHKK